LPAIMSVRKHYTQAKITLMVGAWSAQLFTNNHIVDEVIQYNAPRYVRTKKQTQSLKERWRILKSIGDRTFDLVIGLQENWATLLVTGRKRVRWRLDRGTFSLLRVRSKLIRGNVVKEERLPPLHEVVTNLGVISLGSIPATYMFPVLTISKAAKEGAKNFLNKNGLFDKKFIIFHPAAMWKYRQWGLRKFGDLGDRVIGELGLPVLFTGSKEDVNLIDAIQQRMNNKSVSAAGIISLEEFAGVVEQAHLMVANDGGAVHIASALGCPVIALFGPENPELFGPWSLQSLVLRKKVPCSPCRQITCIRHRKPCMDGIEVEEVFQAVKNYIQPTANLETGSLCVSHHA
jgi:heptosyltransferase I